MWYKLDNFGFIYYYIDKVILGIMPITHLHTCHVTLVAAQSHNTK